MELGFQHVEVGPTSNFVGNHMTQGAIDLVQAELEKGKKHSRMKKDPLTIEKCAFDSVTTNEDCSGNCRDVLKLETCPTQPPDIDALRTALRRQRKGLHSQS